MTHREKVEIALSDLTARGVKQGTIAPPIFKLLWKTGIEIPPPLFIRFVPLALLMGIGWGLPMATIYAMFYPLKIVLSTAPFPVAFFGLTMAAIYRWKAYKLQLPAWKNYPKQSALSLRQGEKC